jgi:hypothetical protein
VLLHDGGVQRRDSETPQVRGELAGLEIAGDNAIRDIDFGQVVGGSSTLLYPFKLVAYDDPPGELYLEAVRAYGGIGYSPDELRGRSEEVRARADSFLAAAISLGLTAPGTSPVAQCGNSKASPTRHATATLPPGGVYRIAATDNAGELGIRRFADTTLIELGPISPGDPVELTLPADSAPVPWTLDSTVPIRVCSGA